jgi:hypothetical protein
VSESISRWWWYAVLYFACIAYLIAYLIFLESFGASDAFGVMDTPALLAFLTAVTGFPLLGLCLFVDSDRINASSAEWNPNSALYGVFGTIHRISLVGNFWLGFFFQWAENWAMDGPLSNPPRTALLAVSTIVCLFYLIQRFRKVGFR